MNNGPLNHTECTILRGFAILGIILHNYCHWLPAAVKENEFLFKLSNSESLMNTLLHPSDLLPIHLLSFFGHYGVPVFLFLSGYGLVKKYEAPGAEDARPWPFIQFHYLKLFRIMIVGFIAFTLVDAITRGTFHYTFSGILYQLLMVGNFHIHPERIIWPGPYWFFGLMLQLYVIYRLLFFRRHWAYVVTAIAICGILQACCEPESNLLNLLRYNCIGGMLPFGTGILYARFGKEHSKIHYSTALILSAAAIFLFSLNYQLWLWTPLFITLLALSTVKMLPSFKWNWMAWVGQLSMPLFVCHPIARKIFIPLSKSGETYAGLCLYLLSSLGMAWIFMQIYNKIPQPRLLNKKRDKKEDYAR